MEPVRSRIGTHPGQEHAAPSKAEYVHHPQCLLRMKDNAFEVHIDKAVELGFVQAVNRNAFPKAAVVDQGVDLFRAELLSTELPVDRGTYRTTT